MIAVLILKGKGNAAADEASVQLFHDIPTALDFCEKETRPGKYWTFAQMMDEDEVVTTYRPDDL